MFKLYERPNSPYWYAEIPTTDGLKRLSTGVPRGAKTRGKAQQAAESKRLELLADLVADTSPTLSQVWIDYSRTKTGIKKSTLDHYGGRVADLIFRLNNPRIVELTTPVIRQYVRERRGKTSDLQLRAQLAALSSVFQHIIDQDRDYAPEFNPVKLVSKNMLATYDKRPRWLKPEELERLWTAVSKRPLYRDWVTVFLETGMRRRELLDLEWSEVDVENARIHLKPAREKTKKGRVIPLTSLALNTLLAQKRYTASPYVFTNPKTRKAYVSPYKTWITIRTEADLPRARIHDLRHTLATHLRHQGVAKEDRMDLLGHSSEDAHSGYADKSIDILREVLEKHSPNTLAAHETKT